MVWEVHSSRSRSPTGMVCNGDSVWWIIYGERIPDEPGSRERQGTHSAHISKPFVRPSFQGQATNDLKTHLQDSTLNPSTDNIRHWGLNVCKNWEARSCSNYSKHKYLDKRCSVRRSIYGSIQIQVWYVESSILGQVSLVSSQCLSLRCELRLSEKPPDWKIFLSLTDH